MKKMMAVERINHISPEDFYQKYVKTQTPVVITQLTQDWPAYHKWNFEYIKQQAGDQIVDLYNNEPVSYDKTVNQPDAQMPMAQYVDALTSGRTTMRIFFFNVLKKVPSMMHDFLYPKLGLRFLKSMPALFFGGYNVNVFMHYDIDYPNLLHFHFVGQKRCILVAPQYSPYMYRIPHAVIAHEDIDFDQPDLGRWPALAQVQMVYADLQHGDVLYMPEGWWHYMKYITPGFSMTLRALATRPKNIVKALYGLFVARYYDNLMRRIKGAAWLEQKNQLAIERTHRHWQKNTSQ